MPDRIDSVSDAFHGRRIVAFFPPSGSALLPFSRNRGRGEEDSLPFLSKASESTAYGFFLCSFANVYSGIFECVSERFAGTTVRTVCDKLNRQKSNLAMERVMKRLKTGEKMAIDFTEFV